MYVSTPALPIPLLHTHTTTAHLTFASFCFLVCAATPVCKKLWSRMTRPALPVVAAPTPTLTMSPMMTLPLKYAVITAFGCGAACKLNNKKPWHSSLSLLFGGLLETYLAFCFVSSSQCVRRLVDGHLCGCPALHNHWRCNLVWRGPLVRA